MRKSRYFAVTSVVALASSVDYLMKPFYLTYLRENAKEQAAHSRERASAL